ncbi:MAG: LytTR family DNA-binding domain-containing protein [Sphingobium sp.]
MRDFASFNAESWLLRLTGRAGLAMLFAAILAFLAPFGTYRFDGIGRVGYWTVQMAAWLILSQSAAWFVSQVPGLRSRGAAQRRIAATVVATLPMMLVVGVATNMMIGWLPNPADLFEFFVSISLIGGGYTYLSDRLVESLTHAHAGLAPHLAAPNIEPERTGEEVLLAEDGPTDTALIERLPPHIRGEILCLQVEDHYVRVHSRSSSAMVLMRFSDALRGIDHIPGSQVHRSWWVATDAVTGLRKTGRTALLTLSNGASVPVSQPYVAQAVSAWGSLEANGI